MVRKGPPCTQVHLHSPFPDKGNSRHIYMKILLRGNEATFPQLPAAGTHLFHYLGMIINFMLNE
jgi:hypothetical protein